MIDKKLEEMIYEVRGQYVMLDSDLALLYGYSGGAKVVNQALKRNIEHFYEGVYFQITDNELENLKSHNLALKSHAVTSKEHGGSRKGHTVFTKEGIKILSEILRKTNVPEVTNNIIETFENMKQKNILMPSNPLSKEKVIRDLIYEVNGIPVILDIDLARLYGCKNGTKEINQAVKNNLEKFPERYSWILSNDEFDNLRSKFLTSNDIERLGNRRYKVRVFTEQGTWMLSTVLKTETASQVTMRIIDTFVAMRKYIGSSLIKQSTINNQVLLNTQSIVHNTEKIEDNQRVLIELKKDFETKVENINQNTEAIERLNQVVHKFDEIRNQNAIFFQGQIYDAYSKLVDIMSEAKEELIIVDGYADKKVLDIISKFSVPVILFIKTEGNLSDLVINTYKEQYGNLTVIRTNAIHDRFIILDRKVLYNLGASINHTGRGAFAINVIEDEHMKKSCLDFLTSQIDASN